MHLLLSLLLALTGPARADEPSPETPEARLEAAVDAYLAGDHDRAEERLLALLRDARDGGAVPFDVEAEAWVYLGELQYLAGDIQAAEASFRMVLQQDPDHRIGPADHPMSVVGAFGVVRTQLEDERRARAAVRRPMPWWGYAPFGAPQFAMDKPVRGGVYLTLQTGFAAASIASWVVIDQQRARINDDAYTEEEQEAAREKALLYRNAWSIPAASAFYVTWGASIADAGIAWRRTPLVPTGVGVAPLEGGARVDLAWQF